MKILNYNVGALTNFEVVDFLRSRGASKDTSRMMANIAASEFKVYDHLIETAACNQTREIIDEFLEKSKGFGLAKAEILTIINLRPCTQSQIYPIIEKAEERFQDTLLDLVEMVVDVLPVPPDMETAEEANADVAPAEEVNEDEETAEEAHADEETAQEVDSNEENVNEEDMS